MEIPFTQRHVRGQPCSWRCLSEADVKAVALGGGVLARYVEQPGAGAGGDVGDEGVLRGERDRGVDVVAELLAPDPVLAVEAGGGGEVAVEDVGVFDGCGGHVLDYLPRPALPEMGFR